MRGLIVYTEGVGFFHNSPTQEEEVQYRSGSANKRHCTRSFGNCNDPFLPSSPDQGSHSLPLAGYVVLAGQ